MVGRLPPTTDDGSITAAVERSMPPSAGTQLAPLLWPARMCAIRRLVDAWSRPPSSGVRVASLAVETNTRVGFRPVVALVKTVRQVEPKFAPQPLAVAGGMWTAASQIALLVPALKPR